MTTSRTFFISDLHLNPHHPQIMAIFLRLLEEVHPSLDALYILGDLFEVWIGDDDHTPFHQQIISALKTATQKGLPIYFMRGNRDFLVGKKFLQKTGCKLLSDEEKIILYGTPLLLMHGDTLCTRDGAYLKARKLGHNKILQTIFLSLPLTIRKKIVTHFQNKSKRHKQSVSMEIMDVTDEAVIYAMKKHNVHHLIHGHTHRPAFHSLLIDGKPASRIVLAAWHDKGSILSWDENGKKEIIEI